MPTEDQIPLPCTSCGAPMRETTTPDTRVWLGCDHCGCTEALPNNLQQRVAHLRARLANLASAQGRLHDFVKGVLTGWGKLLPIWASMYAWMAYQLAAKVSGFVAFVRAPPDIAHAQRQAQLAEMIVPTARVTLAMGGIGLAFVAGYVYTRIRILPLVLARPPLHDGGNPRCRCCGGALSKSADGFLDCEWCGAQNVVTAALARGKAATADNEADTLDRFQRAAFIDLRALARRFAVLIYATLGVTVLGEALLPYLVFALVGAAW